MSTERDELAEVVKAARWKYVSMVDEDGRPDGGMFEQSSEEVADEILAAGYRKPQQVTTVEELEALPAWSIVRVNGICFQRSRLDYCCWAAMTGLESYSSAALAQRPGPFTVLHVGGAE